MSEYNAWLKKRAAYQSIRSFIRPRRKHVDQAVQLAPKNAQAISRKGKVVA
jgi:hypothetical protein